MTCHSIRTSFDGSIDEQVAETAIDSVLTSYDNVVPEQSSPSTNDDTVIRNSGDIDADGVDYHYCLYRFAGDQDKSSIINDIEAQLIGISASWYKIEYHKCYHDEAGGACGDWQVESESGTVPDGV